MRIASMKYLIGYRDALDSLYLEALAESRAALKATRDEEGNRG